MSEIIPDNKTICSLNKNQNGTCIPKETYNILSNTILKKNNLNSNEIINELANKTNKCNNILNKNEKELCVLTDIKENNKNNKIGNAISKQIISFFKPKTKKLDGNYWLNNTEIDQIQYQFQLNYPGYYYSYIHMIDLKMFEPSDKDILLNNNKIYPIKEINFINELTKNNNKLTYNDNLKYYGIVCNTDLSTNNGLHWFSIFIDFTKNPIEIEYFNSSGYSILDGKYRKEREDFLKFFINLADDLTKNGFNTKFVQVTEIEHQRHDTANCGSYSLYYIWSRLNKKSSNYFQKNKILDEDMEKFRSILWREPIKKN